MTWSFSVNNLQREACLFCYMACKTSVILKMNTLSLSHSSGWWGHTAGQTLHVKTSEIQENPLIYCLEVQLTWTDSKTSSIFFGMKDWMYSTDKWHFYLKDSFLYMVAWRFVLSSCWLGSHRENNNAIFIFLAVIVGSIHSVF